MCGTNLSESSISCRNHAFGLCVAARRGLELASSIASKRDDYATEV